MLLEDHSEILVEQKALASVHLKRYVIIDCYLPKNIIVPTSLSLLLINDGQNLEEMPFDKMYNELLLSNQVNPVLVVAIHASKDRKNEYGTSAMTDYEGRGAKAKAYQQFITEELLPFIHTEYFVERFTFIAFAGFSLGGLSALDIVWHHPDIFSSAGVFSGSLWWRSKALDEDYDDALHRIMHQQIKTGTYKPGLRFYFTTGSLDETADRNNNGIIDSIDDTLDLISELKALGYDEETDIRYVNYPEGRHDIATWGNALPGFLLWAFSR
jgi:enterochelin esterase-like enzyme